MSQESRQIPSPAQKRSWMKGMGLTAPAQVEFNWGFGPEQTHYRGISRTGDLLVSGSKASKVVPIDTKKITSFQAGWHY